MRKYDSQIRNLQEEFSLLLKDTDEDPEIEEAKHQERMRKLDLSHF